MKNIGNLVMRFWVVFFFVSCSIAAQAGDDLAVTIEEEQHGHQPGGTKTAISDLSAVDAQALSPQDNPPKSDTTTAGETAVDAGKAADKSADKTAEKIVDIVGPPAPKDLDRVASFEFLGTFVKPGTAQRLAWSPEVSFAGIAVPTPVLVVHGAKAGPVLCLTAAVHGDELNGIEIVRQTLFDLDAQDLAGTVVGVPIVNLQGFRRSSRYLPDRRDLNRYFPGFSTGSSASRIAHSFFDQVIRHCDILVDIHTGSFKRTNLPQLRADLTYPEVTDISKKMGDLVVLQSQGAKGSLRRAAVEAGIPAVTLEAGEPHSVQMDAVNQGVKSIESLLHLKDMYKRRGFWARATEPVYYKSRWVRAQSGGVLVSSILLGERVKEGQTLGTVTDPITNFQKVIVSPIAGRVIGMALNQVMMPGFAAYHIGYQTTVEEAAELDAGPDEAFGDEPESDVDSDAPPGASGTTLIQTDMREEESHPPEASVESENETVE